MGRRGGRGVEEEPTHRANRDAPRRSIGKKIKGDAGLSGRSTCSGGPPSPAGMLLLVSDFEQLENERVEGKLFRTKTCSIP